MSDLFRVSSSGNTDIVKRLQKLENGGKVAIERTVSDFATRAPGWVSKGIRQHYGVDTAAIKEAAKRPKRGQTSITVAGIKVDGATLEYKGRLLTPVHFKMSPKTQPEARQRGTLRIPGQSIGQGSPVAMISPPKPYKVKATIIKGKRATMPAGTFIAPVKGGANLAFRRTGESRLPIEAVRTISVPQMIEGRARETIEETISSKLGERFEHHMKQVMK